jgi:hypothetical protein
VMDEGLVEGFCEGGIGDVWELDERFLIILPIENEDKRISPS